MANIAYRTREDFHCVEESTAHLFLEKKIEEITADYINEHVGLHSKNVYDDVMRLVEPALFSSILVRTRGNQSKAADLLGLNRGTFRKGLVKYGLIGKRRSNVVSIASSMKEME